MTNIPEDDTPKTWFEWEQRKVSRPEVKGAINEALPPQPPNSPWAADPVGPEPLIDRTDDALFINMENNND